MKFSARSDSMLKDQFLTNPLITYSDLFFHNLEYGNKHNPYDQELREQQSIQNGDTQLLQKSISEDYLGKLGTLSKNPLRNSKYLAVVLMALASRSAIRGGLAPEIALSLCDAYIQEIDNCSSPSKIERLKRAAEFQFAAMVHDLNQAKPDYLHKKSPYILRCKEYITLHLHEKLTVSQIAQKLGLNADYLSCIFHKYEGISLTSYIRQEKIRLAKNMLLYSSFSYSEIAANLGFSSQSHLGKYFKELTGYTLSEYRKNFQPQEMI